MTKRYSVTIYNEKEVIAGIKAYQKREEINHFTNAVTKLLKIALRSQGLMAEKMTAEFARQQNLGNIKALKEAGRL